MLDTTYKEYFERVAHRDTPEYAKEYFDHLYNEYLALPPDSAAAMSQHAQEILQKRQDNTLKWSDVYGFDLMLVELLPLRDLARKAYDMRAKYRSIAGQRDYDAYVASRPPDLPLPSDIEKAGEKAGESGAAPPIFSPPALPVFSPPISSPPALPANQLGSPSTLEGLRQNLRADVRYLLGQFYLYYALLPYREGLRDEMTRRARNWTFVFLGVFAAMLAVSSLERFVQLWWQVNFRVPTILVVAMTGVVGGAVSMLQRIQSAPAEGDAIFNLASLSNGWAGMSLSPLYGAVFAVIFYMMFTGGVINGVVFPAVKTPEKFVTATEKFVAATPTTEPASQPTTKPAQPTNPESAQPPNTVPGVTPPSAQPAQPSSPAATQSPTPTPPPSTLVTFTEGTYPEGGKDYALLIIWSFLAGFLERLVPDALNRLVTKTQNIEGPTS